MSLTVICNHWMGDYSISDVILQNFGWEITLSWMGEIRMKLVIL